MNEIEKRAQERFEAWCGGRYNLSTRKTALGGTVYADRWVQGAWVGFRSALTPPDGYVLIQNIDAKRLSDGDTNSPGWELSARRVRAAMLAARPEVP